MTDFIMKFKMFRIYFWILVFAEQIKSNYLIRNNYALCALSTLTAQHKAMRYHRWLVAGFSQWRSRFSPRETMWNLQWKSGTEVDFCMSGFLCQLLFHQHFILICHHGMMIVEPVAVAVPSTWSHPTTRMNWTVKHSIRFGIQNTVVWMLFVSLELDHRNGVTTTFLLVIWRLFMCITACETCVICKTEMCK